MMRRRQAYSFRGPTLTRPQVARARRMVAQPLLRHDCGAVCSAACGSDGTPYCCDPDEIELFPYEWDFVRSNPGLLLTRPESRRGNGEVRYGLVECLRPCAHARNLRPLACMLYPLMPFLSRDGRYLGITFDLTFEEYCVWMNRFEWLTAHTLRRYHQAFRILLQDPQVRQFYLEESNCVRDLPGGPRYFTVSRIPESGMRERDGSLVATPPWFLPAAASRDTRTEVRSY